MGRILHELQENQNKVIDNIMDKLDEMEERAQRQNEGFMLKLVELMTRQQTHSCNEERFCDFLFSVMILC